MAFPALASPAGRIVIEGSATGSHLRLSTDGSNILVDGAMAETPPRGCAFTHHHDAAACPLDGVEAIELNMGSGNDYVEVLDRLPFPLTAHLGSGQDKFIGNGEPDYCFPEGSRRNRCIGEGGNDICITGAENSDCHGEAGNDRLYGELDPDQLYGGEGFDFCNGGPGKASSHACEAGPGG